jgi:hypothetical protein
MKTQVTTMSNIWRTRKKTSNSVFHPPFSITSYIASQRAMEPNNPYIALSQHRKHRKHSPTTAAAEPQPGDETRTFAASS